MKQIGESGHIKKLENAGGSNFSKEAFLMNIISGTISSIIGGVICYFFFSYNPENRLRLFITIFFVLLIVAFLFCSLRNLFFPPNIYTVLRVIFLLLAVFLYRILTIDNPDASASLFTIKYHGVIHENQMEYPVTVSLVIKNNTLLEDSVLVYDRYKIPIKISGSIVGQSLLIYEILDNKENAALVFHNFSIMDKKIEGEWSDLINRNREALKIALTKSSAYVTLIASFPLQI